MDHHPNRDIQDSFNYQNLPSFSPNYSPIMNKYNEYQRSDFSQFTDQGSENFGAYCRQSRDEIKRRMSRSQFKSKFTYSITPPKAQEESEVIRIGLNDQTVQNSQNNSILSSWDCNIPKNHQNNQPHHPSSRFINYGKENHNLSQNNEDQTKENIKKSPKVFKIHKNNGNSPFSNKKKNHLYKSPKTRNKSKF